MLPDELELPCDLPERPYLPDCPVRLDLRVDLDVADAATVGGSMEESCIVAAEAFWLTISDAGAGL